MLEQSPGSASGYLTVADYYADSGDTARAITDYEHTLELAPARADVHDRLALAYFKQGARARGRRSVEAGFLHPRATGQQHASAGELLGGLLPKL